MKKYRLKNIVKGGRLAVFFSALLFCLLSFLYFLVKKEDKNALMSGISILYTVLPLLAQKLFRFRINGVLYLFVTAYTVSPLLGYAYGLYYATSWWDDVLHAFSGVLFAMFGAYLPTLFCKNQEISFPFRAFCAFFFSVAVAGLWEIIEFSMDTFFSTDMQKDTLLSTARPSYLLSELLGFPLGQLGEWNLAQIAVDGELLPYYIDLGLIDSMQDMFIETLGAAVYTALYCASKGKRFCFIPSKEFSVPQQAVEEGLEEAVTSE